VVQCVLGAVFTCVAVLGSAFVLLPAGTFASTIWMPVIMAVLLGVIATHLRKQPNRRMLAAGMLIGIAVALLLDGMCWLIIFEGRFGG
jgi:Na+/proline symporter